MRRTPNDEKQQIINPNPNVRANESVCSNSKGVNHPPANERQRGIDDDIAIDIESS
jgi:hypothetical protein